MLTAPTKRWPATPGSGDADDDHTNQEGRTTWTPQLSDGRSRFAPKPLARARRRPYLRHRAPSGAHGRGDDDQLVVSASAVVPEDDETLDPIKHSSRAGGAGKDLAEALVVRWTPRTGLFTPALPRRVGDVFGPSYDSRTVTPPENAESCSSIALGFVPTGTSKATFAGI